MEFGSSISRRSPIQASSRPPWRPPSDLILRVAALRCACGEVLADRHQLLVLDTCEHVIGAAAALAEEILRNGLAPHIIATSREPLRAGASGCIRFDHSTCLRSMQRLTVKRRRMVRLGCSSSVRAPQIRILGLTEASWGGSSRLAGGSTGSRLRSSWRRRAPPHSGSRNSPGAWTVGSPCSPEVGGRLCHGTRLWRRHSIGATHCCPRPSASSSVASRSLLAPSAFERPSRFRRNPL